MTEEEREKWLRVSFMQALEKLSPENFTSVIKFEDIVDGAYFESRHWMNLIFGDAHDPHKDAVLARHSYYIWRGGEPGFDLLRHQYKLGSRTIKVTEAVGMIHVAIHLGDIDEARRLDLEARASSIANWLLRLPAQIRFVRDPLDGMLISNLQNRERAIRDWKERIYAICGESTVELLIYKEDPRLRPSARNLSIWFGDEFRGNPPKAASR